MKMYEYRMFIKLLFILLWTNCTMCILNRQDVGQFEYISDDPVFGCRWIQDQLACNCQSMAKEFFITEKSISPHLITTLKIKNCENVQFGKKAIYWMRNIRQIELSNINKLQFDEFSFLWDGYVQTIISDNLPSVSITISNSNITNISANTFKGVIKELNFLNVKIDYLSQYAFSLSPLYKTRSLNFINTQFNKIEPQAFKKFHTESIVFDGVNFDEIPSRAFSDLYVYNKFIIKNSNFHNIRSLAFLIYQPLDFRFVNSKVRVLEGEGFKITTRGDVFINNNEFNQVNYGAFKGISLNIDELRQLKKIKFDNNKFNAITSEFLNINTTSFELELSKTFVFFHCNCKLIEIHFKETNFYNDIFCLHQNEYLVIKDYKKYECSYIQSNATIIIVVCVVLILVIITASILIFYFKKIRKSDKYGKGNDVNPKVISLIVPDGKTYKETEVHVVVERVDLLTTDL